MTGISRAAAMLAFGGAMAGFACSLFVPHRYQTRAAIVFVRPYDSNAKSLFARADEITLLPESLELLIRRSPYYRERLYLDRLQVVLDQLRASLRIESRTISGSPGATIEFEDDDADTALDVTSNILSDFGGNAARLAGARKSADVIRIVRLPETHLTGLTPMLLTAIGLAAGLLAAFALWATRLVTGPVAER